MIFSGAYFPLCGVDEAMVYANGTDGGTAKLGRAVVVMVQRVKRAQYSIKWAVRWAKSKG